MWFLAWRVAYIHLAVSCLWNEAQDIRKHMLKHRENHKTLPWEHHISCQMCLIALFCRGFMIFLTAVTTIFFYFLSTLESAIWHIWQPMWFSLGSVLRFTRCFSHKKFLVTKFFVKKQISVTNFFSHNKFLVTKKI